MMRLVNAMRREAGHEDFRIAVWSTLRVQPGKQNIAVSGGLFWVVQCPALDQAFERPRYGLSA